MKRSALLLLLCMCLSTIRVSALPHFNDLILLLGFERQGIVDAIVTTLAQALEEQSSPIIVSGPILGDYLEMVQNPENIKNANQYREEILKCPDENLDEKHKEMVAANKTADKQMLLSFIKKLSNDAWYGYHNPIADLILLVPKKYILNQKLAGTVIGIDNQVKACGFNIGPATNFIRLEDMSQDTLGSRLLDNLFKNRVEVMATSNPDIIAALKSLLDLSKASSTQQAKKWNIYWAGHGILARKRTKESLKSHQRKNKFLLKTSENAKKQYLSKLEKFITLENPNSYEVKQFEKDMKLLFYTVLPKLRLGEDQKKAFIDELELFKNNAESRYPYKTAMIAGVSYDNFESLINFFNDMNVEFLYYLGCCGAGRNLIRVNEILNRLNVDFFTVTSGINELLLYSKTILSHVIIRDKTHKTVTIQFRNSFTQFFEGLHNFFDNKAIMQSQDEEKIITPLAEVIKEVIDITEPTNQPYIRIPQTKAFRAINVNEADVIFTSEHIKKYGDKYIYVSQKKTLPEGVAPKKTAMIDSIRLRPSLLVGKSTDLIAQSPSLTLDSKVEEKNRAQTFEYIQYFERIGFSNELWALLFNLGRYHVGQTRRFLINKLGTNNYKNSGIPTSSSGVLYAEKVIIYVDGEKDLTIEITNELLLGQTIYPGTLKIDLLYGNNLYSATWDLDNLYTPISEIEKKISENEEKKDADKKMILPKFKKQSEKEKKAHLELFNKAESRIIEYENQENNKSLLAALIKALNELKNKLTALQQKLNNIVYGIA